MFGKGKGTKIGMGNLISVAKNTLAYVEMANKAMEEKRFEDAHIGMGFTMGYEIMENPRWKKVVGLFAEEYCIKDDIMVKPELDPSMQIIRWVLAFDKDPADDKSFVIHAEKTQEELMSWIKAMAIDVESEIAELCMRAKEGLGIE